MTLRSVGASVFIILIAEDWKPAADKLAMLGPEHRASGFLIRPPEGARHRITMDEKEVRDLWGLEVDAQTPRGLLIVTVAKNVKNELPPEKDIEIVLNVAKTKYKNLVSNPPELGTINGHWFARVRFRADAAIGLPGFDSGPVFGFLYVTDAGETPVVLHGIGRPDGIELLEASAQTVRIMP
jgi:hypothetical protein